MSTVDAVVIGAGGPTGRLCVEKLLSENKTVRAVVRNPDKYKDVWQSSEKLSIVKGDITDEESLLPALEGAKGVIVSSAASTYFSSDAVEHEGVAKVARVAKKTNSKVVLISSALVTPKRRFHPVRLILNKIRWNMMDAKFAGETALRESGVPYTIVRPFWLTDTAPGQAKLVVSQRDDLGGGGQITRADVAAVCVAALDSPKATNTTFEIKSDPKTPLGPSDLASLFDGLEQGVYT